jgi:hypothetical protein
VNVAKAERARFSHALTPEGKKNFGIFRGATISRRWIGFSEDDVNQPPKAQISGGEGVRQLPDQRFEDNAFHHVPDARATAAAAEWDAALGCHYLSA